jgi:signal transduction histidine kinase
MDSIVILLIISAVVNFVLGFFLFLNSKKYSFSRLYGINVLTIVLWSVLMIFFRYSDQENIVLITKLLYISGILIASTFLYFSFFFPDKKNFNILNKKLLIFLPNIILVLFILFTDLIIANAVVVPGSENLVYFGYLYPAFFSLIVIYVFSGFLILLKKYFLFKNDWLKKQQILYLLGSYAFATNIALVSNVVLPWVGFYNIQWLGQVTSMIMVVFTTVAIFKYKLFDIKVIATQVLIFILWIILLIRITISENLGEVTINIVLFLIGIVLGVFIIKSVNREIFQKEEIEKLAQKLQKTNEELKELDKMKTEFLSLATHQIRSPLTSMRGYISMIFEGDYGEVNENLKEPLRVVEKSSEGLIKIVNDFLDVSRIEQGRMKYNLEVCDFRQIVKNIIEEYRPAIEEKGLKIEFEAKEDDYSVKVDENKMEQVIGNLIDNAIKYTIDGGIKIYLFKNDSKTVQLEVSDSGVGIPPEEIKKLFTKFQRAKGAEKTNVTGTGLGIYLAKRITEDHGGTIKVYSDGEGKGAVFTVTLPVV